MKFLFFISYLSDWFGKYFGSRLRVFNGGALGICERSEYIIFDG
jgi:hypothetical protein